MNADNENDPDKLPFKIADLNSAAMLAATVLSLSMGQRLALFVRPINAADAQMAEARATSGSAILAI